MKKISTLIFCTIFVATAACAADDTAQKSPTQIVKDALKLAKDGQFSQAMDQVNALLDKNPSDTSALRARGNIFFAENKFEEAYQDFNKIVSLNPSSARAYFDRGIAGFTLGNDTQSVNDIDQALSMNPKLIATLDSAPKIREKIDELRKQATASVGNVRLKNGTVKVKNGSISLKENVLK